MVSVYVGNLSYETSWQTLKDHMKEAGEVVRANVKTRQDGRSAGFGIVEFADEAGAANAIETLMDTELDGRKIVVREDNGGKQREGGGDREGGGGPVRSRNGGSGTTVFVGNLSYDTTWQSLKDHMKEAGEVRRPLPLHPSTATSATSATTSSPPPRQVVRANIKERADGKPAGFGLVEYASAEDAENAIATMTDSELDGRQIFVREDNGGKAGGGGGGGRGGSRPGPYDRPQGRGRGRGRGGGGGGRGGKDKGGPPKSAADLDADMDSYFAKKGAAAEE